MKKIILSFFTLAILFAVVSCNKKAPTITGKNNLGVSNGGNGGTPPVSGLPVGDVPLDFTKKALLEEFTGEWCGWCPEGAKIMEDLTTQYPDAFIGVAVHDGDPMELPAFNTYIKQLTNVGGFPNGSVDRADATGRGQWTGQVQASMAETATCGIAMVSKLTGTTLDLDVYVGYNAAIAAGAKITVCLVEDHVPQSSAGAQSNYSSTVVVDANWQHNHVLRGILTADAGDDLTIDLAKKYSKVSFAGHDLSQYTFNNIDNVHVVAFVNLENAPRDVLNAQKCDLNQTKKWD